MAPASAPTKNRAHLPPDAIPYSMLVLLGPNRLAAIPVTSQHLLVEHWLQPPEGRKYPQQRRCCRDLLMEEWKGQGAGQVPIPPLPQTSPLYGSQQV